MQNFIELYELLMPCEQFAQKCFNFQEISKTSKCSEPPPPPPPPNTLPEVMYIMIICHGAILHCNMSFKTIAGRSDGVF